MLGWNAIYFREHLPSHETELLLHIGGKFSFIVWGVLVNMILNWSPESTKVKNVKGNVKKLTCTEENNDLFTEKNVLCKKKKEGKEIGVLFN